MTVLPGGCGAILLALMVTAVTRADDEGGGVGTGVVTAVPEITKSIATDASASSAVFDALLAHTVIRPEGNVVAGVHANEFDAVQPPTGFHEPS